MTINLYTSSSDARVLDKVLNPTRTVDARLLDSGISLITPVLTIAHSPSESFTDNYAYIPQWGRYYYITNYRVALGGRVELSLEIDVLMTYRDQIKQCPCTASRATMHANHYLTDNELMTTQDVINVNRVIPSNVFTSDALTPISKCMVLTVSNARTS